MALWHSPASIPVHHHQVVHRLDMCHAKRGNLMNRVASNACANCEYNAPNKDMTIDAHMLHLQGAPSLIPMCTPPLPHPHRQLVVHQMCGCACIQSLMRGQISEVCAYHESWHSLESEAYTYVE